MDKDFMDLLEFVIPAKKTTASVNADKLITEEDRIELSKIGKSSHQESCQIMKKLLESKPTDITPLLYRKAIYFLAYRLYHCTQKEGVQAKVIKDLNISHNIYSKWEIEPIRDYKEGNDWGERIELKRDGKKNEILLYMFNEMIGNVKYKKFADVFGGLGTVTTSMPIRNKTQRYINDFDELVANFLAVIKFKPTELENICKKVICDIETQPNKELADLGAKLYQERIDRQNKKRDKSLKAGEVECVAKINEFIYKLENQEFRKEIEYAMGLYKKFEQEVDNYRNSKKSIGEVNFIIDEEKLEINMALAYYYIHSFHYKGRPTLTGVDAKKLDFFKNNINKISNYSKRFKNVIVTCCDFKKLISSEDINDESTLLYLDSPYYRSKPYVADDFSDEQHIALHDSLKNFKGKWVFSCRDTINEKFKYNGEIKINNILEYFEMYADIAEYVVYFDDDKNHEIMITNFDFITPNIQGFNSYKYKKYENKYSIDGDRKFTKESYKEFLERQRKKYNK